MLSLLLLNNFCKYNLSFEYFNKFSMLSNASSYLVETYLPKNNIHFVLMLCRFSVSNISSTNIEI